MAATAAAPVVAEEDTELRDLLVQTLENSGVLNRIKAELRAAVFLALEEQEKIENKTPLVNESLKKFLNTKDGRLVASLVAEFLQFFNLDFTLAVFQPETSTLQGLGGRAELARDLGIAEADGAVGGPLLLEVLRRCQQRGAGPAGGQGALDVAAAGHPPPAPPEGTASEHSGPSKIPRYKGQGQKKTSGPRPGAQAGSEASHSDASTSSSEPRGKGSLQPPAHETGVGSSLNTRSNGAEAPAGPGPQDGDSDGDSFFDDPVPKPEKTYGWRSAPGEQRGGDPASGSGEPPSQSGRGALAGAPSLADTESERGNTVLKGLKLVNDRTGSLGLGTGGGEDDYADDFSSTSHRSGRSGLSLGEEIEEDLSVGLDDATASDKLDDLTQDLTVSQLSDVADYLEDVACA
ncbi:centrosomal protein 43 isoform X2 [Phyllostomus discolor]|uniref:Centrosomal protein 43 n=1 Tax=Phyllostomus discolor TaxID=89673 RepID=A0A7E6DPY7_9CHIR|nr:centrosomal protein 43 isoform X2 [Phyllostomus discolor]